MSLQRIALSSWLIFVLAFSSASAQSDQAFERLVGASARYQDPAYQRQWITASALLPDDLSSASRVLLGGPGHAPGLSALTAMLACADRRPDAPLPRVWLLLAESIVALSDSAVSHALQGIEHAASGRLEFDRVSAWGANGLPSLLTIIADIEDPATFQRGAERLLGVGEQGKRSFPHLIGGNRTVFEFAPDSQPLFLAGLQRIMARMPADTLEELFVNLGRSPIKTSLARSLLRDPDHMKRLIAARSLTGRYHDARHQFSLWGQDLEPDEVESVHRIACDALASGEPERVGIAYALLCPPSPPMSAEHAAQVRGAVYDSIDYWTGVTLDDRRYLIPHEQVVAQGAWNAEELFGVVKRLVAKDGQISVEPRRVMLARAVSAIWALEAAAEQEPVWTSRIFALDLSGDDLHFALEAVTRGEHGHGHSDPRTLRRLQELLRHGLTSEHHGACLLAWRGLTTYRTNEEFALAPEVQRELTAAAKRLIAGKNVRNSRSSALFDFTQHATTQDFASLRELLDDPPFDLNAGQQAYVLRALVRTCRPEQAKRVVALVERHDQTAGLIGLMLDHEVLKESAPVLPATLDSASIEKRVKAIVPAPRSHEITQRWQDLARAADRHPGRHAAVRRCLDGLRPADWTPTLVRYAFVFYSPEALAERLLPHVDELDRNAKVRFIEFCGLTFFHEATGTLRKMLRSRSEGLQADLTIALERLERGRRMAADPGRSASQLDATLARIDRLLATGSAEQKIGAIRALGSMPADRARSRLLQALESESTGLQSAAAEALGRLR